MLIAYLSINVTNLGLADEVAAPEKADFFKILGIQESDITPPLKTKLEPKITPKMYNFLSLNSIDSMTRTLLYSQESCGARSFQFITLQKENNKDSLLVFYPCSEKCLGSLEKTINAAQLSSKQIDLPRGLCTYLWGRSLNFVEINGL